MKTALLARREKRERIEKREEKIANISIANLEKADVKIVAVDAIVAEETVGLVEEETIVAVRGSSAETKIVSAVIVKKRSNII